MTYHIILNIGNKLILIIEYNEGIQSVSLHSPSTTTSILQHIHNVLQCSVYSVKGSVHVLTTAADINLQRRGQILKC